MALAPLATRRLAAVVLFSLAVGGCATTASFRTAENAEFAQDYDLAVAQYTRALQEDPDNRSARLGLERTRVRAAQNHFTRGRRFEAAGRLDEALVELQLASELSPGDPNVEQLLNTVRTQLR